MEIYFLDISHFFKLFIYSAEANNNVENGGKIISLG